MLFGRGEGNSEEVELSGGQFSYEGQVQRGTGALAQCLYVPTCHERCRLPPLCSLR